MTGYTLTDGRTAVDVGADGRILTEPYTSSAAAYQPAVTVTVAPETFARISRGDHAPTLAESEALVSLGWTIVTVSR